MPGRPATRVSGRAADQEIDLRGHRAPRGHGGPPVGPSRARVAIAYACCRPSPATTRVSRAIRMSRRWAGRRLVTGPRERSSAAGADEPCVAVRRAPLEADVVRGRAGLGSGRRVGRERGGRVQAALGEAGGVAGLVQQAPRGCASLTSRMQDVSSPAPRSSPRTAGVERLRAMRGARPVSASPPDAWIRPTRPPRLARIQRARPGWWVAAIRRIAARARSPFPSRRVDRPDRFAGAGALPPAPYAHADAIIADFDPCQTAAPAIPSV